MLKLKYTKFDFGCRSAPEPAGGAYIAAQNPQLDLRSLLLREREEWGLDIGKGKWRERVGQETKGGSISKGREMGRCK